MFLVSNLSKKSIVKKKTISKIPCSNPSKMKHSVSFASTTNTSQLKNNTSKKSILKSQNIHPVIKSPQLTKKIPKLSINTDEDNMNDTHLEELLEIEGKKMLSNLSETFKMTTGGKFIINTQVFKNHKADIENKDYISNLIYSKRMTTKREISKKRNFNYFSPQNSTFKNKNIYQKIIDKNIIRNKQKENIHKKKTINKTDIVNFLITATEEKKKISHNKVNSNGMSSSSSRSKLSYVPSVKSISTKTDKSMMRAYKI